jgi:hypothetical protein
MAYRKSLDFLPSIFQTRTNEKLLRATLDQLIAEPEVRQLNGYIGRKFNPALTPNDSYVQEDFVDRQNYQLEPASVYTDSDGNIKFVSSYVDLLNRITSLGGIANDPSRLFSADQYSYSGLFDFDKFINYSSYYWLPNGPDSVSVFATEIPVDQDINVTIPSIYSVVDGKYDAEKYDEFAFDISNNSISRLSETGYKFSTSGNISNPVVRVARGGTYRFNVNQLGHGFYIQTLPGTTSNYPWQKNLSIRSVLGVENNGEDVGTVTFNVPARNAQDFFANMEYVGNANLVAYSVARRRQLRYTEIQNANYQDFLNLHIGIDGQRFIDGKNILFLASNSQDSVPEPWQARTPYREGDLVIYANTVYRVLTDYTTGRLFSTANLEIYDIEDHWFDPALFDNTDVGFDGENYDRGADVAMESRLGWFTVRISDEGIIQLTPVDAIGINKRITIGEGIEFGNREIYRTAANRLELVPPLTANLDFLYYQDALDPNINGIIEIVDQDNNLDIDVGTIIGSPNYTSPNGIVFENGLKVRFIGNTTPAQYENNSYYVEGVGSSIELVSVSNLETPESWLDTVSTPFDSELYDTQGFDQSQPAPVQKQYITIKRNSQDGSAWTRQNRWFHESVIENTNAYNNFNTVLDQNSRAKRPVIEFDANLQLFNFGERYKTSVTVIDVNEVDALSNVEGVAVETVNNVISGYYSDGVPLVNGNRVIFANDRSESVRKTIWQVKWITPESVTNNKQVNFVGDGATTVFDLNFDVTSPIRLSVLINGETASQTGYLWSLIGQNIIFNTAPPDDSNITVTYTFGQQIHLVAVDTVVDGDVILSTLGKTNQGTNWFYQNAAWNKSQNKTSSNQAPLFDLFDVNGISVGDNSVYNGSNFAGSKIFSYKIGNTVRDSELGIRLAYRSIGNVGDILFVDHIANDSFSYEDQLENSVSARSNGLNAKKNLLNGSSVFVNQWVKLKSKTRQFQTETFFATQYQKNRFKLNVYPAALGPENILVYKNNIALIASEFDVEVDTNIGYLILTTDLAVGDKLDVKIYSKNYNARSVWEIPSNLENNAKNQDVVEITLGQMRNHILESFVKTPDFVGKYQGSNNIKDLPNVKRNGGKILQNAGAPHLANLFLNDTKANFVESLLYAQREYSIFKNKFQRLAAELDLSDVTNPALCVDEILKEIFANKNEMFAYYRSDMVPAGDDYTKLTYVVSNPDIDTYYLGRAFDIETPSNRAVTVYINGQLLTYGLDYTFSSNQPIVQLNIAPVRPELNQYYLPLNEGDVIEIREYNNTDGFHVPQTPTKLGLYPTFRPRIIQDGYDGAYESVIRGHDGSLTVAFGDYRDGIILELEKRIYNNIKSRYTGTLFDIQGNTPGAFRSTDYSKDEFDLVLSTNFSSWLGKNNLQLNSLSVFDSNNPFTWNYSKYANRIDRSTMPAANWRGLYQYFYDTEQPQLRPWEMLGFTEQPDWWVTQYGPAPYTSGNTVLWDDLEAGIIREGVRAGVDTRFARPGLKNIIPVDDSGTLLSPLESLALNTSIENSIGWTFGDSGPVETAWKQSSEYPYAIHLAMALTKPAEYFGLFRDTNQQISRQYDSAENTQWEFADIGVRNKIEYVHGEVVSGTVVRSNGYLTWMSEYATSLSLDVAEEIGRKLREVDLRLAYKVSGYTDKKYIKLYADQSSPDSVNTSVLIPDEDFQIKLIKSAPRVSLTYSGVIVTRLGTGFSVRGYDQAKPYFIVETGKNNGNTRLIKVGSDAVDVLVDGSGTNIIVPYGTELLDKSEVVDFLVGLGRYQQSQGFRLDRKVDVDSTEYHNWYLAAKEFLFWTQQGWDNDVAISLSPIGDEINFRSIRGAVDAISNKPYGSRILNNNFEIIDSTSYTVNRDGRNFSLKTIQNQSISLADIDVVDYEHVIVLNNKTQFNDIIYQPELGNRQYRIKISGFKSGAWNGTFGAPGFIINDNNIIEWQSGKNYYKGEIVLYKGKYYVATENANAASLFDNAVWVETEYNQIKSTLLPNLANKAGQPKSFYDFNRANLELDADRLGKSIIGFAPRDYLDNLGISDTSQVKFYQGLIRQKGSNNSLNKLLRAKLDNFDGLAEIFEQWAVRDGVYGASGNTRQIRIPIAITNESTKNPAVIELLNANDLPTAGRLAYKSDDLLTYSRPYDKNILSYRNAKSQVNDLPSAGFVKINEVDYTSATLDTIGESVDSNVTDGSRIWVGRTNTQSWNVYRFTDVSVSVDTITIAGNSLATLTTKTAHGLDAAQGIFIKSFADVNLNNYYTVDRIIDDNTFTIKTNLNQLKTKITDAKIYTLIPLKQQNSSDIASITPLNGWKNNDQFYLESASSRGWGVYERSEKYNTVNRYVDADAELNDNLGVSVAASRSNNYLLAGSTATSTVQTYKRLASGVLVEDVEIEAPSTGLDDFGAVIAASSANYAAVGSPISDDVGYVHILRKDTNDSFIVDQAIAPFGLAANGKFGSAIAISEDARWLYVGQPDTQGGYLWVYQLINADSSVTQQFLADGSTASFTITGTATDLATNIYSLKISDVNGKILIPFRDYTFDSSTKVITFTTTPTFGEINVFFRSYYNLVLAASLASETGDRFGASIATSTDGSQLIVGAPLANDNSTVISDSGKVYIIDRTVESQYADGVNKVFGTALASIFGIPLVRVDGDEKIEGVDYSYNDVDTVTFVNAPASGSIVTIDSNNPVLSQIVLDFESPQTGAQFGYSLDLCPNNCSLYVGAPFEDDTTVDGGRVHRFINQGRFFGNAAGTKINPVISETTAILLNNFVVQFNTGDSLTDIAANINVLNIPGVTALTIGNVLAVETNREVFADKLNIVQLSGNFLDDVGIEVYAAQQVITSPREKNFNNFGKVVKINPAADTLAVGTDVGDSIIDTTFDNNTTGFDRRNTEFFARKQQSGVVFVYQLISNPNSTVANPSQFILAEQLTANDIAEFDQFGASIDMSTNTIYVGAPGNDYDNIANSGIVYGFSNPTGEPTWNLIREESPKIDLDLINGVYLYDSVSGQKVIDLDIIDPAKGKVSGVAAQEITYQTTVNPAFYNNATNTTKGIVWGKDHVGEIWWNTQLTQWIEYEQDTVEYRAANWGFSFPGSRIICAEWTESLLAPDSYSDANNPESYPLDTTNYNVFAEYNATLGRFVNKYYFWVAGKTQSPKNIANRSISAIQIEELIANPKLSNVPYISFLEKNSFGLYNITDYLTDDTVLVIDYDVEKNESVIHSEYELIAEGDTRSMPSNSLLNKLFDSLAGQDLVGNLVPDIHLTDYERIGVDYRPRQTMFVSRRNAVREAVAYINQVLIDIPVVYSKDISALVESEPFPDAITFNEAVENFVELEYLNIGILPVGYLVLVKSDETTKNRWVVYAKDSTGQWQKKKIQSYNNSRYITRIDWTDASVNVPAIVTNVVDFEYNLQSLTAVNGDFVKIKDNGNGLFKIVVRENNKWRTVQEQNGTVQINENIWKTENNLQGWDNDGFDLQLFDDWPSLEIQKILRAVYSDIFVNEHSVEKNLWFLHMIKYALSEVKYADWAFKTSLIKVNQTQRAIKQIPVYQRDNQDLISSYINEVKPYHTKISEFILQYNGDDAATLNTTDFDLPAYYNFATGTYRSPTGLTVEDDIILQLDPYINWTNNYKLEMSDIDVFYGGSGYFTPPDIVITGGGGSGAQASAIVANGRIIDVVVTNPGSGYITTPTVTVDQFTPDSAILSARMSNNKVRSFDTTIKFDRVATTSGWLIEFKDSFGDPVDVRNEKISRISGEQGVLDEVLNLFSLGSWLVASQDLAVYPVANVPNFRVDNDNSGRVRFFDRRDTRGWTPALMQSYIRALGFSAGVNNIDVTGTTVTVDGSYADFNPSLLTWVAGATYYQDELIAHDYAVYRVTTQFTAVSADFELTYLEEASATDIDNHLDRTWAYYQPTDGMLGRDLTQLFKGTSFLGNQIIGANFSQNPGFDVGAYDASGFDLSIIGPEGVAVIDPSILDQTLYSTFLDTTLGTRPEDLITTGGSFVDVYHSHAPEEMVPGSAYDSLNIQVHSVAANLTTQPDGYGLNWRVAAFNTDGVTTRFDVDGGHIGDYFLAYLKNGGPLYRNINETGQDAPSTVPVGGYFNLAQQRSYSIDFSTDELVFAVPPADGDILTVYNIAQAGESIILDSVQIADGVETDFDFVVDYASVAYVMVLVNGVEVNNYVVEPVENEANRVRIAFDTAPSNQHHIHVVATNNFERNTLSKFYVQQEMVNNSNRIVDLDEAIRFGQSKDTVMVVELNGSRLRPGNTNYYTGDSSTTVFLLPNSASEQYQSLTFAEVQVWVDGVRKDATHYQLSAIDGSTIPYVTFYEAPLDGSDISVTYTAEAEYFYDETNNTVRIREGVEINNGSLLAVITSSDHDIFKFKTKVFVGTQQLISSNSFVPGYDEGGFDSLGFDSTETVQILKIEYDIGTEQNDASRIFVHVDGRKQVPNFDYTVSGGKVILADSITITNTTEVIITWMSANVYRAASTYRIFKGMDDVFEYTRIAVDQSTVLAQALNILDTEIVVQNGNNLSEPNAAMAMPGVVFINGERIVYYTKNGNVLGQLRRGTLGTGAKLNHAAGSRVVDSSTATHIPNASSVTWYDAGTSTASNGRGLQASNTQQARFITALQGLNIDP